jgi:hypothetical protein
MKCHQYNDVAARPPLNLNVSYVIITKHDFLSGGGGEGKRGGIARE